MKSRKDLSIHRKADLATPNGLGVEQWVDEAETRAWFLFESGRGGE